MHIIRIGLCVMLLILSSMVLAASTSGFPAFVDSLRQQAATEGVSKQTINKYLVNLKAPQHHTERVAKKVQHRHVTITHYYNTMVNDYIVKQGRLQLHEHKKLLAKIEKTYQVPASIIVALWGLESHYGKRVGAEHLIQSLATLAYNHHRSSFYRHQLIDALHMLDKTPAIPQQLKSTYDGGMGQPQFEPTTYLSYSVDFNKDGFANIWTDDADALASIASYLHRMGWDYKQGWGMEVTIPNNQHVLDLAKHKVKLTTKAWKALGVKPLASDHNPKPLLLSRLRLPDGPKGRAFLITHNVDVLMRWNYSTLEALTTGLLSHQISKADLKLTLN